MIKRVMALVVVVTILIGGLIYSQQRPELLKVSGFIEADEIRVGSRIGGRVKSVTAVEGAVAKVGETLVELEPFDLLERQSEAISQLAESQADYDRIRTGFRAEEIAEAKARRAQSAANLEKLKNGPRPQEITAAEAEVTLAKSQLNLATLQHQRTETLFAKMAVTSEEMDEAASNLTVARARLQVRAEQLELLQAGNRAEDIAKAQEEFNEADEAWKLRVNGYRTEEIQQAKAAVQAAEAALRVINTQIGELTIKAPVNGMIEAVDLQPGDLVASNAPVISLLDPSHLWVRAYIPENRLSFAVGDEVSVTVDSFPRERFRGRVTYIARHAEFTPGNVQTPEERSKQVFRFKVTLLEGLDRLRPGMAADVWLDREE